MFRIAFPKILLLFLLTFLLSQAIQAQDDSYHHAGGLRGGPITGLTFKKFQFPPTGVIEGILGFNYTNGRMISLTGLYEHHFFITYRMNFFAGGGFSVAFNKTDFELPLEAIIGLEYNLETFPIGFSLDFKPSYRLFDKQFTYNEVGISVRYFLDGVL